MPYASTKTFGHELGLSCAFRQWRAIHSHCRFLHGYALSVRLLFEADLLDERGWVVDFGGLRSIKSWLTETFDHKTLVAQDDPALDWFHSAHQKGLLDLVILPGVGCERFAHLIWAYASSWLVDNRYSPRCRLVEVEVREHGANSAIFRP